MPRQKGVHRGPVQLRRHGGGLRVSGTGDGQLLLLAGGGLIQLLSIQKGTKVSSSPWMKSVGVIERSTCLRALASVML